MGTAEKSATYLSSLATLWHTVHVGPREQFYMEMNEVKSFDIVDSIFLDAKQSLCKERTRGCHVLGLVGG